MLSEQELKRICRERGLKIERRGDLWHISGPGVDVTTTDLSILRESELRSVNWHRYPRERWT